MKFNRILLLVIFLLPKSIYSQPSWKDLLSQHEFLTTENKNDIPLGLIEVMDIDSLADLANPGDQWNATSNPDNNIPEIKLNWASSYGNYWVISITRGGYSIKTYYYFLANINNDISVLSARLSEEVSFSQLKTYFLNNQLQFE